MARRHRGTFKRGQVSETDGQRKWLARELDEDALHDILATLEMTLMMRSPYLSRHLDEKVADGDLTLDMGIIRETLADAHGNLVEYNETCRHGRTSRRVLLRDYESIHTILVGARRVPSNLCFVIDIDTACVVTAYWNRATDRHDTLNVNRYERVMLRAS